MGDTEGADKDDNLVRTERIDGAVADDDTEGMESDDKLVRAKRASGTAADKGDEGMEENGGDSSNSLDHAKESDFELSSSTEGIDAVKDNEVVPSKTAEE